MLFNGYFWVVIKMTKLFGRSKAWPVKASFHREAALVIAPWWWNWPPDKLWTLSKYTQPVMWLNIPLWLFETCLFVLKLLIFRGVAEVHLQTTRPIPANMFLRDQITLHRYICLHITSYNSKIIYYRCSLTSATLGHDFESYGLWQTLTHRGFGFPKERAAGPFFGVPGYGCHGCWWTVAIRLDVYGIRIWCQGVDVYIFFSEDLYIHAWNCNAISAYDDILYRLGHHITLQIEMKWHFNPVFNYFVSSHAVRCHINGIVDDKLWAAWPNKFAEHLGSFAIA